MGYGQWFAWTWPGVSRLWHQGAWDALAVAGLFGVLVNVAIYLEWVIPQEIAWPIRWMTWSVVIVYWVFAQRREWRLRQRGFAGGGQQHEGQLREAQKAYLQGRWVDAEQLARSLVAKVAEDREARLLLVSVLRRTGRHREALYQLRRLASVPGADKWRWEAERERALLEERFASRIESRTTEEDRLAADSQARSRGQRAAA